MADDRYDKVLAKAKLKGVRTLTNNEMELFKKLLNEHSQRGRAANALLG